MANYKRRAAWILLALLLLGGLALGSLYVLRHRRSSSDEYPKMPRHPKALTWYQLDPEGTVSADGTPWHGDIRIGTENRLIVYFFGGGMAFDDYTVAHSYSVARDDGFYFDTEDWILDYMASSGIGADREDNPFRSWSIIAIPYTTGDMHIGAGETAYTASDGAEKAVRFRGYDNYRAMMAAALQYVEPPEELLILGTSAGGFGAALLAEDVMGYFPETENVTVCVDSSYLVYDRWPEVARELWQAPEAIAANLTTDNILLDPLRALHRNRPETKLLYTCSVRDGELARFQSYIDTGRGRTDRAAGDALQRHLRDMAAEIGAEMPDMGLFFWEGIPFTGAEGETLTRHTVMVSGYAYEPLTDGVRILDWVHDAVEGRITSHGLSLLEP